MNVDVTVECGNFDARMKKLLEGMGPVTATISNEVFYVPRLEYGYSRQAPYGMVRVSLREIRDVFAKVIKHAVDVEETTRNGKLREGIVEAVNTAADWGMGLIRDRTPIRTGRARRGWQVDEAR
jgi:hypothetical protein